MITRAELEQVFSLNEGAAARDILASQAALGVAFPHDYVALLTISNGLFSGDRLMLLEVEDLAGRNLDYEVQAYLPGYIMIGDDSGGTAILMKEAEAGVFEVGMGDMSEESMELSAESLRELLIEFRGQTLGQRSG